jgi:hypothetical protein
LLVDTDDEVTHASWVPVLHGGDGIEHARLRG